MKEKAKITINRLNSAEPELHNKIVINIHDERHNNIIRLWISAKDFALSLTGLAFRDCDIER